MLDVLEEGIYATKLAADSDIRTDFPRYRIWKDGEMVDEVTDAREIYNAHPDLVTFLIGCSFHLKQLCKKRVLKFAIFMTIPMCRCI